MVALRLALRLLILTQAQARAGIEMVKDHLESETIEGKAFFYVPSSKAPKFTSPRVHLLPNYDEYLIAYRDRDLFLDRDHVPPIGTTPSPHTSSCSMAASSVAGGAMLQAMD